MPLSILVAFLHCASVLGCVFILIHASRFNAYCAGIGTAGGVIGLIALAIFRIEFHFSVWRFPEAIAIPVFFLTGYALASPVAHVLARLRSAPPKRTHSRGYIW